MRDETANQLAEERGRLALRRRLLYETHLLLPGFEMATREAAIMQLMLGPEPAALQFERFTERVLSAMGKKYLPVYRMADGEFAFAVGRRAPIGRQARSMSARTWWRRLAGIARRVCKPFRASDISTMWGESYTAAELPAMRRAYVQHLQHIAHKGILAIHFTRSPGRFSEEYIDLVCEWLDRNGMELGELNYTSFYFVYALLNGPQRRSLYGRHRIAVATSADRHKRTLIEASLRSEGALDVQFLPISPTRTMTDNVDLAILEPPIDLVLVAGGIGSANILAQLEPLQTVCLDAGVCVECLADPRLKTERSFLIDDAGLLDRRE